MSNIIHSFLILPQKYNHSPYPSLRTNENLVAFRLHRLHFHKLSEENPPDTQDKLANRLRKFYL